MNLAPPPVRMQRVEGRGAIGVRADAGKMRLGELFQEGAAKIRLPAASGDTLEAVLINTAGGMTGGDRLDWQARAGEGAGLSLTTQACEKIYKSNSGAASVGISLEAGTGARLAWLPQETILFNEGAFARHMTVDLAADAQCLLVEALILGRKAMGETVRSASYRDRWRVRVEGRLVHAEDFRFDGDAGELFSAAATASGARAMATVLLIGPDAGDRLEAARTLLATHEIIGAGASAWEAGTAECRSGKLLARIVAEDGYHLRGVLQPLIELLNGKAGLPRIWSS